MTFCFSARASVDIVYTWVDGSDEEWLAQKMKYLGKEDRLLLIEDGYAPERFRNKDELKYSLRSVAQFAPWVHHIYIVTAGQKPSWLKETSLITVINHKDIFKNQENLPTFNSHAIEANLHHIPWLSEKYIYFNDDVFLGQETTESDFFTEDGKARVFTNGCLSNERIDRSDGSLVAANKNTAALLSLFFEKDEWFTIAPTMQPCKRSAVYAAEKALPEIFTRVSSHRFRSFADCTMTNGIIPNYAIESGYAVPSSFSYVYTFCGKNPGKDFRRLQEILEQKPFSFCIQDSGDLPASREVLTWFLEQYFPTPAPWEKTTEE